MKTDKELKKVIVGEFMKEATITTRDNKKYYFVDFSFDKGLLNKVADNIISKLFEDKPESKTASEATEEKK